MSHLVIQILALSSRVAEPCRTRQIRSQISDCWEHDAMEHFDDERWRATFQMLHGIFVRLFGCQAPCLVHQDAPHTLISDLNEQSVQTEDASVQNRFISHFKPPRHVVWIRFAKIGFHVFFCPDFLKSIWIQSDIPKIRFGLAV